MSGTSLTTKGKKGATASVVIPWFVNYLKERPEMSWKAMAWWIHDHLDYSEVVFFHNRRWSLTRRSTFAGTRRRSVAPSGAPRTAFSPTPTRMGIQAGSTLANTRDSRYPGNPARSIRTCPVDLALHRPTGRLLVEGSFRKLLRLLGNRRRRRQSADPARRTSAVHRSP